MAPNVETDGLPVCPRINSTGVSPRHPGFLLVGNQFGVDDLVVVERRDVAKFYEWLKKHLVWKTEKQVL